ncbi:MAG: NAD(P)H-hydrate dehydratase [Saprospirales bacterium]|nr:MAG: NAD(P)H-hydrate dehydratase [Saprospirales bacterium]
MKALPIPYAKQIKSIDLATIKLKKIPSINLMEEASVTFSSWFEKKFHIREQVIFAFCGQGNNGGDGLAVSRLLIEKGYKVRVILWGSPEKCSKDCKINYNRLKSTRAVEILALNKAKNIPLIPEGSIIIDALLGSGLDRPLEGELQKLILQLNSINATRISIDIPSGLFSDKPTTGLSFAADEVLSFEFPKLAFLMPENEAKIINWDFRSIGLRICEEIEKKLTNYWLTTNFIQSLLKKTNRFSHKGTHGAAFIIAGQKGFCGAAVLASKSCLRAGCGLLYTHLPESCLDIVQKSVPEAICKINAGQEYLESDIFPPEKTTAIGVGPGIGTKFSTARIIEKLFKTTKIPILIDADALNIIASNNLLHSVPENAILTPHPGEFRRLFGESSNDFEELELQRKKSVEHSVYIVFKGAFTRISTPDGIVFFNSTGNPGLAKAGSGDVLTGIITGLLARSYSPFEASVIGVHLHGLAADLALINESVESLVATDVIKNLGKAFQKIKTDRALEKIDSEMLEPPIEVTP